MTAERDETPDGTPARLDEPPRSWFDSSAHLGLLHRVSAVVLAIGLSIFGILGLVNRLEAFTTQGQPILGLSSNGLLSVISLVVAVVLLAAAVRGGRTASTVLVVVGAAFLLSGVGNVLVLGGPLNLLAFRMSNVVFSLVTGGILLVLGAYGRFTGGLPNSNPYQRERHPDQGAADVLPTVYPDPADAVAVAELAEAERAVARRTATPEQADGVAAVAAARRAEDRVASWRSYQRLRSGTRPPTA